MSGSQTVRVGIFAGGSPLSMRFGISVAPPRAVCTSSGMVGPSLSYGCADAAVVVGAHGALAGAWASALGNRVKRPEDIAPALEWIAAQPEVDGAVVILGERIDAGGVGLQPTWNRECPALVPGR